MPFDYSSDFVTLEGSFEYEPGDQRELQYHVTIEKARDVNVTYLGFSVAHSGWTIRLKRCLIDYLVVTVYSIPVINSNIRQLCA